MSDAADDVDAPRRHARAVTRRPAAPMPASEAPMPSAPDAEAIVVGAILASEGRAWPRASALTFGDFTASALATVFSACAAVVESGTSPGLLAVKHELVRTRALERAGGAAALARLVDGLPCDLTRVDFWVTLIRQATIAREEIRLAERFAHLRREGDDAGARVVLREMAGRVDVGSAAAPRLLALTRSGAALLTEDSDDAPAWLVPNLLPEGAVSTWHGRPRAHKSECCLGLLVAGALGEPAFGHFPIPRRFRSLYVSAEDSLKLIRYRVRLLARGHDAGPEALAGFHVYARPGLLLEVDAQARGDLLALVRYLDVAVVVIDSARAAWPSIDKGPCEGAGLVAFVRELQTTTPAQTVLLLHHDARQTPNGPPRSGGEKASGGAILSASEALIGFEAAGPRRAILTPAHFKASASPPPFEIHIESEGAADDDYADFLRLRAVPCAATSDLSSRDVAELVALRERVAELVAAHPGATGRDLIEQAREAGFKARERAIREALGALRASGAVTSAPGPRGAQRWYPAPAAEVTT